jgi:mannose-6-phosphate isomerase-like protein (cupin superfamily)
MSTALKLENRHTGELLCLRRVREDAQIVLEIEGGVPPHGEGPPLHVHLRQCEEGTVVAGVLTGRVGDRAVVVRAGEPAVFPAGVPHSWWNEADQPLSFKGRAIPAEDLDQFLQRLFAVVNAGPAARPSLFYMAHVLYSHRRTHRLATIPMAVQRAVLPAVVFVGWLLGKYRSDDWPGAPASCPGAPEVEHHGTPVWSHDGGV